MIYILGLLFFGGLIYVALYAVLISTVGVCLIQILKCALIVVGALAVGLLIGEIVCKIFHR